MAVAAAVCSDFEPDYVASDGVSAPWQVFEWYMVEGLVRSHQEGDDLRGLPGRDKATVALRDRSSLSAKSYLKTPRVFGFHGVYRLLAKTLDIVEDERLGEVGYRLVADWEREQNLRGFLSNDEEPGKSVRRNLVGAIKDGLEKGGVARKAGWGGWAFFHQHLHPAEFGQSETQVITEALFDPQAPRRSEVLRFLVSSTGQRAWRDRSERAFHQALRRKVRGEIADLIDAIMLYETFARWLQDAFDSCLHALSQHRQQVDPAELGSLKAVVTAANSIPSLYSELSDRLGQFGETTRFENAFHVFAAPQSPQAWVVTLFEHHKRVQTNKPPNGRAPWLDWFEMGKVMVRPAYLRDRGGSHDDGYVHAYRTTPLHSFAQDLGLL